MTKHRARNSQPVSQNSLVSTKSAKSLICNRFELFKNPVVKVKFQLQSEIGLSIAWRELYVQLKLSDAR